MKKGLLVLPLLLVLIFSRCNFTEDIKTLQGAFDSLQVVVGTPQFNTSVVLQFFDAKTEALIRDKKISVTISGKNSSDVYSNIGMRETVHSTTLGLLPLVIDPKVVDTVAMKTTPIEFDVVISVDGYLSTTQRVKINEAKMNMLQIRMISFSNPPQGVSVAVNNSYSVAGTNGHTLSPANQSMNLGKQTVSIPTGVILKDASGNPISGSIKSEIVFYDPVSETAQNAFPGGTNVTATLPDGSEGDIEFISAGMFTINLTAGDKKVKTLENGGIKLRTVVPRTLINPKTGLPIKAGDQIEMWSKEDNTGEWVYEKTSLVKEDNGDLILEESVNHLSSWNWDFFESTCRYGASFVFKGELTGRSQHVKITSKTQNRVFDNHEFHNLRDRNLRLYRPPTNTSATFTFEDAGYDTSRKITFSPSTLSISDLCSNQTYEIIVSESIPAANEEITVNFNVSATSKTNSNFVIKPTMILYQEDERSSTDDFSFYIPNLILLINGEASASFNYDKDYVISGSLGNSSGKGTLRLEKMPNSKVRVIMTPTIDFSGNTQSTKVTLEFDRIGDNVVNLNYNAVLPESLMNRLL
jgi:hypothetical protein